MPNDVTRGQEVQDRRRALKLTQVELAAEAGVSEQTVRNLEGDKYRDMRKGRQVIAALERLEAGRNPAPIPQNRRSSDTPAHRAAEQVIRTSEGERIALRFLSDGTRAIFVVPEGGQVPSDDEIEEALRKARGEG